MEHVVENVFYTERKKPPKRQLAPLYSRYPSDLADTSVDRPKEFNWEIGTWASTHLSRGPSLPSVSRSAGLSVAKFMRCQPSYHEME
jgi:hypothetical protein